MKEIDKLPNIRFSHLKSDARRRGILLDLTLDQCKVLWSQPCTYCNKDLSEAVGSSLDRLDNSVGYTLANVQSCCGDCNKIRGRNFTVEETKVFMAAVLKFRSSNES